MDGVKRKSCCIKEYTLKELAGIYEVSLYIMRKRLKAIKKALGKRDGNFYKTEQVKLIFDTVKLPSHIDIV